MKQLAYTLVLGTILVLFSCKNETTSNQPEVKTPPSETTVINEGVIEDISFKTKTIMIVFDDYIALKNALVNTNTETAKAKAIVFKESLKDIVDVNPKAAIVAQEIIEANDVEKQRQSFGDLTLFMEEIIKDDVIEGAVFKQYCPMAFKNKGAYWLSNSKEIRNPYFGDKMLKCGRVAEEIN